VVKPTDRYLQAQQRKKTELHRALRVLDFPPGRWLDVLGIAFFCNVIIWQAWPLIARFWRAVMGWFLNDLIPGVQFIERPVWFGRKALLAFPALTSSVPNDFQWWLGTGFTALCFAVPLILPDRFTPLRYFLCFAGLLQLVSQVFFLLVPGLFPYAAAGYLADMLELAFALLLIAPWLLGLVYHIFPFSFWRKLALTLLMLAVTTILTPLQYSFQAWLVSAGSLLWLPILYFLAGVSLNLLVFVCLYAWAMSWRSLED
jgi:hypothetical protein